VHPTETIGIFGNVFTPFGTLTSVDYEVKFYGDRPRETLRWGVKLIGEAKYRDFKFRTLCVFEPHLGSLGTTYDGHLGLIGKHVVDFLLVLVEVFSLGVTAEALRAKRSKIGDFAPTRYRRNFREGMRGSGTPLFGGWGTDRPLF